jgi:hypothetical protein
VALGSFCLAVLVIAFRACAQALVASLPINGINPTLKSRTLSKASRSQSMTSSGFGPQKGNLLLEGVLATICMSVPEFPTQYRVHPFQTSLEAAIICASSLLRSP